MNLNFLRFIIFTGLTVFLVWALNTRFGMTPPLGKFLDPFGGVWQNAEGSKPVFPEKLQIPGLQKEVKVVLDENMIPRIFAENNHDLYLAQGYVTAVFRLWQMEFQTHAAAGRLSEVFGPIALETDRTARRKGMVYGAKNTLAASEKTEYKEVMAAYTEGVNAYINSLEYKDLPLEYKLFDYKPEAWEPLKTALLLKYMAEMLSFSNRDLEYTNALKSFGREYFEILYPESYTDADPIVDRAGRWNFEAVPADTVPIAFPTSYADVKPVPGPDPDNGSNNWAVSGTKTASGYPILCDDPHLGLNLPSIWFAQQLTAPGINVFGVTVPGAPSVIIGFNDSIAWGVTNAQRDLVDWYQIEYDKNDPDAYILDGKSKKFRREIEEIKVFGGETFKDTVLYTDWGPIMYDNNFKAKDEKKNGLALRWAGHDGYAEGHTFYLLNKAKNYTDFLEAMKFYACPAQNFVYASASTGDIAIRIQGKFPLKQKDQGKFIMDGSRSSQAWNKYIPFEHNVTDINPARGFVSSANQQPADSTYPYYYTAHSFETYRNRRINNVLDSLQKITPEDMMRLQGDNYNMQAAESLPFFLSKLALGNLNEGERKIYDELKKWDFYNDADKIAPGYYQEWWNVLYEDLLWDEMQREDQSFALPDHANTIKLLKTQADFAYMDIQSTSERENATDLIRTSFKIAADSIQSREKRAGGKTDWGNYKDTKLRHLIPMLDGFHEPVRNGGYRSIVNATSEKNGPSWRMITELNPKGVTANVIYPGGQSGNPGSRYYIDYAKNWADGKYLKISFLRSPSQAGKNSIQTQSLLPK